MQTTRNNKGFVKLAFISMAALAGASAHAMELDWSGQFRTEFNLIHDYSLDNSDGGGNYDPVRGGAGGYYVPGGGTNDATFQTLFLRLRPKLVVNDNIYIKSEWWVGDPIYGIFGNAAPYPRDQRQFNSTYSRGSLLTVQRFWGEFLTDIGTLQIGRAPLNYGLGIVWNSGDGLWDRYQSTGDMIRLISKFGAFTFEPAYINYTSGNNVSGSCNSAGGACVPQSGNAGVSDYSLLFKYDNPDEDFEASVNFIKRLGGASQDPTSGYLAFQGTPGGLNFNTWDIFARKKFGRLTLSGEVPLTSGNVAGVDYSTFGLAGEADWKINDSWDTTLKAGHAPGQDASPSQVPAQYRAFYFHPNYHIAMIMFDYQLANFFGPQTLNNPATAPSALRSPYDNPITNASYFSLNGAFNADKWRFDASLVYARAAQPAANGNYFLNSWTRTMSVAPAKSDQGTSLGWETDLGATFHWDEYFQFRWDLGLFFPGDFYKFSNVLNPDGSTLDNPTNWVFATALRVGVNF